MAHFYGTVKGQRGEASRLGSKSSGLRVTCNGWNAGITSRAGRMQSMRHEEKECDVFYANFDGGSGGRDRIGSVRYYLVDNNAELEPDAEFMRHVTAAHWEKLLTEDPDLARTLRAMMFCNLDKVPA